MRQLHCQLTTQTGWQLPARFRDSGVRELLVDLVVLMDSGED